MTVRRTSVTVREVRDGALADALRRRPVATLDEVHTHPVVAGWSPVLRDRAIADLRASGVLEVDELTGRVGLSSLPSLCSPRRRRDRGTK